MVVAVVGARGRWRRPGYIVHYELAPWYPAQHLADRRHSKNISFCLHSCLLLFACSFIRFFIYPFLCLHPFPSDISLPLSSIPLYTPPLISTPPNPPPSLLPIHHECQKLASIKVGSGFSFFKSLFPLEKWLLLFSHQVLSDFCCPMDCSSPGSFFHGILQARTLEWFAISFSRGSFWPRDWTWVSCIGRWILYHWATREALKSDSTF